MMSRDKRVAGTKFPFALKTVYGIFGCSIQIVVLIFPLIVFANLFSEMNDISNVSMNIDLLVGKKRFNLYT